jgi:hypothetical protein
VEELREAEWEIKRITNELELAKNQKDRTDFDILTSYTIDQWIEKWKQSNKSFPLLSNPEELFLHLESHRDDYKESYNIMGLNQISRQLLTKKYEQSPEWKETQRMLELQKTPRTINDWFKEGFIRQEQLDKIHELSRRGIKTIDFNKLYDWGEITKMILATGVID